MRLLLRGLIALFVAVSAVAQESADTRNEFWPEVQVLIRTSPKTRLFLLGNVSRPAGSHEKFEGQVGAYFDYLAHPNVWFRAGYQYGKSLDESSDYLESRFVVEQTFKATLPGSIAVADRNREEFRFVTGDYSFRYRNRLNVERDVIRQGYRFTPYGQAELFFDSRSRSWSRNVYTAGIVFPLSRPADGGVKSRPTIRDRMSLDVYFTRQNDKRSDPRHVNAVGVTLQFAF